MKRRENFSAKTIQAVKLRAAYICSRPECRCFTIAPSVNQDFLVQYQGKIAHITAAAPNGPRYEPAMTYEERTSIHNAIFLCSNCADLIDKNEGTDYDAKTLRLWKEEHHNWVTTNLNKSALAHSNLMVVNHGAGSITAHTVKISNRKLVKDQENKKHDRKTFKRSEKVFSEKQFYKMFRNLSGSANCKVKDKHRLTDIQKFLSKAGNSYIHLDIDAARLAFLDTIPDLDNFLFKYFDKWPYRQDRVNFNIQLRPELLRDTGYRKMGNDDYATWQNHFANLQQILNKTFDAYNHYRRIIKEELHI